MNQSSTQRFRPRSNYWKSKHLGVFLYQTSTFSVQFRRKNA